MNLVDFIQTKRFWKSVGLFAVVFAALSVLIALIFFDDRLSTNQVIFQGLFFGVLLTLYFFWKERQSYLKLGIKAPFVDLIQVRKFTVNLTEDLALQKIKNVLLDMKAEIVNDGSSSGIFEAKKSGQSISIGVVGVNNQTVIFIHSSPRTGAFAFFDLGINYDIVETFQKKMIS